ncbi:hypothetical protein ACX3TR_06260 [Aerococcus mictus]
MSKANRVIGVMGLGLFGSALVKRLATKGIDGFYPTSPLPPPSSSSSQAPLGGRLAPSHC